MWRTKRKTSKQLTCNSLNRPLIQTDALATDLTACTYVHCSPPGTRVVTWWMSPLGFLRQARSPPCLPACRFHGLANGDTRKRRRRREAGRGFGPCPAAVCRISPLQEEGIRWEEMHTSVDNALLSQPFTASLLLSLSHIPDTDPRFRKRFRNTH